MTTHASQVDAIARYVAGLQAIPELASLWSYGHPRYGFSDPPEAPALAETMLDDAEFRALGLGTWLGTTDGRLVAEAVARVIPPSYRPLYALVVEALRLASEKQARQGRAKAGELALGTLAVGLVVAVIVRSKASAP